MSVTWDQVRSAVAQLAADAGEWAGAPLPVSCAPLVMEPRYPFAGLAGSRLGEEDTPEAHGVTVRNSWYSHQRSSTVYICEDADGIFKFIQPEYGAKRLEFWLNTMGACAEAFSSDTEAKAVETLGTLLKPGQFDCYRLAGCFPETSRRSGVTYIFRKLRPTIALRQSGKGMRILATLCLHPIGYYEGTWSGVMAPTDDVIAHLMLMRGSEPKFWAKANHHPTWKAEAGL